MSEQHEADMARLIAGELAPDSPEGRAALEAEGLDADELEAMRELARRLDDAGRERGEIGAEAAGVQDAPGSDRIASTLEGLAAGGSANSAADAPGFTIVTPRRRLPAWLLTAAALLLFVPLVVRLTMSPDRGEEQRMGDGPVQIAPEPAQDGAYGRLGFTLAPELTGADLRLRVFASEGERPGALLDEIPIDTASPWSDPTVQLAWPDRVHVQLVATMFGRDPLSSSLRSWSRR